MEATGRHGALVTAVDLVRGLGVLTRMDIVEVPGATGWFDTDYEGKRDAALRTLADGADVFLVHVEATDEAGHAGDLDEKIKALEAWDARILDGLVEGLDALGPWRLLLLPDHATPVELRTHTTDPVPYLLVDSRSDGPGGMYTEPATAGSTPIPGHEMLGRLLARAGRLRGGRVPAAVRALRLHQQLHGQVMAVGVAGREVAAVPGAPLQLLGEERHHVQVGDPMRLVDREQLGRAAVLGLLLDEAEDRLAHAQQPRTRHGCRRRW